MANFTVTTTQDSGAGSLRQAILDANATLEADTITFDSRLDGQTILLTSGELRITEDLTIDGDMDDDGIPDITLQRDATAASFRIFNLDDGGRSWQTVVLDGLVVTGGAASEGGGIRNRENLTVRNSTITNNRAGNYGGGIESYDSALVVTNSTITGNDAYRGGGISSLWSLTSVTDSMISNNFGDGVYGTGGGIRNSTISGNQGAGLDGSWSIYDSTISGNGIGIYLNGGRSATVVNSVISGNGQGIDANFRSSVEVSNSIIENHGGGGISLSDSYLSASNSIIRNNSSRGPGAGIYAYGLFGPQYFNNFQFSVWLNNTTVTGNTTTGDNNGGGGIYAYGVDVAISDSVISGNSTTGDASHGGGIFHSSIVQEGYRGSFGSLTINRSTISGNETTGSGSHGGGIFRKAQSAGETATIRNSTVSGNRTMGHGGGIFNESVAADTYLSISNSTLTENTAPVGQGSGVASSGATTIETRVTSSIIAGNTHSDLDLVGGSQNTFVSEGYNLIGTGSGAAAFNQPTDFTGITNPGLEPLADNGGPTPTHALKPDSLAVNAGSNPVGLVTDQRGPGFARVLGGQTDIGAFEGPFGDPEPRFLTLTIDPTTLAENRGSAKGTIARSDDLGTALTIILSNSDPTEVQVPETLTLAVGQLSASFTIHGVDDAILDGTQFATITASAAGFLSSAVTLEVTDDEVFVPPTLTLTIAPTSISENGGTATAMLTRSGGDIHLPLTVALSSSDTSAAIAPETITFAADQTTTTFAITGVDDPIVEGLQVVTITAAAEGFLSSATTLHVIDDDLPLSALTLEAEAIAEVTGFRLEGKGVASGEALLSLRGRSDNEVGSASFTFEGISGTYAIVLGVFDENDGESTFEIAQNGELIGAVILDQDLGGKGANNRTRTERTIVTEALLTQGDRLTVTGYEDAGESARFDFIRFEPISPLPDNDIPDLPANVAPTITTASAVVVNENQVSVLDINAIDDNGDTEGSGLTYGLIGGSDQTFFALDTETGVLSFITAPDYETPKDTGADNTYEVEVIVTDSTGLSHTQLLHVIVNDVNETPVSTPIRLEAEAADTLINYRTENINAASGGQVLSLRRGGEAEIGRATFNFDEAAGTYDLLVGAFDENDGLARLVVTLNDSETGTTQTLNTLTLDQDRGSNNANSQTFVVLTAATSLSLTPGDTLTLQGFEDGGEHARLDYIELVPIV